MITRSGSQACAFGLALLASIAALPARSAAPVESEVIRSKPGLHELVRRVLDDPHRDFSSVRGPDDCEDEALYLGTKQVLGDYIADPSGQRPMLREYLLSDKAQCSCTRAVIGKDFDILVEDVDLNLPELPCF
ncbi:MAG: hypothetical protein R3F42_08615 [Pseudomonadota bacterium]